MKKQFIVSTIGAKRHINTDLFISDPFVYHFLQKEDLLHNYTSIQVADFTRSSKNDLINDSELVHSKYEKYLPLLATRLNSIHSVAYPLSFWKQYLSLGLIRYITSVYNSYKILTTYLEEGSFDCEILNQDFFYVPVDFEDNRELLLNSDFGQEQILSIYLTLKGSSNFPTFNHEYSGTKVDKVAGKKPSPIASVTKKLLKLRPRHFVRIIREAYLKFRFSKKNDNAVVGVIGTIFSEKNTFLLKKRSKNRIQDISIPKIPLAHGGEINRENRAYLATFEDWFDDFDEFFFFSIQYCMPQICIETFKEWEYKIKSLDKFTNLKYIVSEGWLNDSYINILLAHAKTRGVKHIYNEHNCMFHPFVGGFVDQVAALCDVYASVGWNNNSYRNLVAKGSLFEYGISGNYSVKYNILYVGVPYLAKLQHYSSAWGYCEENVPKNIKFLDSFFSHLGETISDISYRPYPRKNLSGLLLYDKEFLLKRFVQEFKNRVSTNTPSKVQMRQSRLVIIDYISTSYLECLIMNIPFIFFWDADCYYLKENHEDFFAPLTDVGICQTDPIEAARFVNVIKENPSDWWYSEIVQQGRRKFLDENIGNPSAMLDYLVSLT